MLWPVLSLFHASPFQELRTAYNEMNANKDGWQIRGRHFKVILPCALVKSFFAPSLNKISTCLDELKRNRSLTGLKYVFMVGGFSSSPLVQAAVRSSFEEIEGCRVVVALQPEVAIVKGAAVCTYDAYAS